jgi:hypothetical protein
MTRLVAYVYPGWHPDPYRPGVDEWDLLNGFRAYFAGHERPPAPQAGPYDDRDPAVVGRQVDLARAAGIEAFTFFAYYRPGQGFVMAEPLDAALRAAAGRGDFGVAATWCIRLPHDRFPVPPRDQMEVPVEPVPDPERALDDTPIELLTLRDLDQLLCSDDPAWAETVLDGGGSVRTRARHRIHGVDATTPHRPRRPRT